MKKLLLSSFGCQTLDLVEELLPRPATMLKAIFIPTAADPYEDKSFVDVDLRKLEEMGFKVTVVDLKEHQGDDLDRKLTQADLVLVAGGNTFYLLDQMRKSGFDILIKKHIERGLIYVGSSAGSAVCCPTIEAAKRFDDPAAAPDLTDFSGLNLYDKILIPHVQKEKYAERIRQTKAEMEEKGFEVVTLTDSEAIVVNGDESRVVKI